MCPRAACHGHGAAELSIEALLERSGARDEAQIVFSGELRLEPAETCAASCLISGPALYEPYALQPAAFLIRPHDRYGNETAAVSSDFRAYLICGANANSEILKKSNDPVMTHPT